MREIDTHFPAEACPFCGIAAAYPHPSSPPPSLWKKQDEKEMSLEDIVPDGDVQPERTQPGSFVVLAGRGVVAFLDILPMVGGHLLVATRNHRVKVSDMTSDEAQEMGFYLPLLSRVVSKVTNVSDWNIVQNNGARAAQVVPHVHFHIIPRPATKPEIKSRSWTMFGRGQRDELDEEEGARVAGEMRRCLREEIKRAKGVSKL
ncbi:HIT-like protein [Bimuria novae-zelandiae CBS 107.79]|uniref:HIT-like protein n=1 Tax=Bimuria novae-zelandiae CBS 107.79 TaxID=1447943 RepID=A0A6A5URH7_9PLEO|nr:HIT-like protein [Bimuria novae-zelandiae CBS 107.79]